MFNLKQEYIMELEHKNALYDMASSRWGAVAQAQMACEECGELIQAISKVFFRGKSVDKSDIVTEMADVRIMIEQLARILEVEEGVEIEMTRKLNRLEARLTDKA
jgi:NTP pyrophosphatase (non-canonical NTP hydrolase)